MWGIKIHVEHNKKKTMKKLFSIMTNLSTHYHFKLDFQKMDQHAGGTWLIHGTKHRITLSCKAWNSTVEYPSRESEHDKPCLSCLLLIRRFHGAVVTYWVHMSIFYVYPMVDFSLPLSIGTQIMMVWAFHRCVPSIRALIMVVIKSFDA